MIPALVAVVWAGVFASLALFQIYRPAGKKPRARWLTALELPAGSMSGSSWELLIISVTGLFLELLLIRWISSEITIFAYFKNFVLIACYLGFGLGCYLSRRAINLMALCVPLIALALLCEFPSTSLRSVGPLL